MKGTTYAGNARVFSVVLFCGDQGHEAFEGSRMALQSRLAFSVSDHRDMRRLPAANLKVVAHIGRIYSSIRILEKWLRGSENAVRAQRGMERTGDVVCLCFAQEKIAGVDPRRTLGAKICYRLFASADQ